MNIENVFLDFQRLFAARMHIAQTIEQRLQVVKYVDAFIAVRLFLQIK